MTKLDWQINEICLFLMNKNFLYLLIHVLMHTKYMHARANKKFIKNKENVEYQDYAFTHKL